ncbi:MAG: hypothetical protein WCE53_16880 [Candidatus Acidiferrum sp.]
MTPDTMLCIQTITQVVLALVTMGALIVLIGYARDTKTIAKNGSEQIESSLLPFIALVEREESGHSSNWAIKNLGKGPALNIYYSRSLSNDKPKMQAITPLAPSAQYFVENADEDLTTKGSFTVDYESLSGKKYRTTVRRIRGERTHSFQRLE